MKRPLVALAALALGIRAALAADASVALYVFDQELPLAGAEVRVDGEARATTDRDGAARLTLAPGTRRIVVLREGAEVLTLELEAREDEQGEIIATLYPDSAPSVFVESSHGESGQVVGAAPAEDFGPPGVLEGRILGSEDGQPVEGARVYVSGTPLDIRTDAEGRFRAELPPGAYTISVIAADFATQTIDGVAIASEQATTRDVELTPAGMELPEFVVLEPYVEGSLASFVEEKRTSAQVTDVLGAEQISRAGDSDAAAALRRVTGISLVGGKFVYVRGFGERYSSVLLNGAQIPSPDPTRRVVPLDLFPTDLLSGIVIQKTYAPDMPGEFAGGTIQLRTRGVPESFLLRVSGSVGYDEGATGEEGLRYEGGDRDWLGRDDGSRAAPEGLLPPSGSISTELAQDVAAQGYAIYPSSLDPDTGFAAAVGDDFVFSDGAWSLGYIGAVRYSQSWESRLENRRILSLAAGQLFPRSIFERDRTERAVDTSLFFSSGLSIGEKHTITATAIDVLQATDEVVVDDGLLTGGAIERRTSLEWIENGLQTFQLGGEHSFPVFGTLLVDWLLSDSRATRESPNAREYTYQFEESAERFRFFSATNRWDDLEDNVQEARLAFRMPWDFGEGRTLELGFGGSQLDRDRDSTVFRFGFQGNRPSDANLLPIEEILSPEFIVPGGLTLRNFTSLTDGYTAEQSLDAYFVNIDGSWGPLRLAVGARQEDNVQRVITTRPDLPGGLEQVALIETDDLLPTAALTWAYSPNAQFRLGYAETVNRPDFRELSSSFFSDPVLDINTQGNPDLLPANVDNIDLRWEYYFSPTESFSVALFSKEITNPIELVRSASSGVSLRIQNGTIAENQGIEFDLYKGLGFVDGWSWLPDVARRIPWADLYVGANYARIESEVDLRGLVGNIQTNEIRPLQGQSPYVGNFSLSWLPESGKYEATLLYNVFGPRIALVGVAGLPDILEEPIHQLDFNLSAALPWDGWKAKLRLRNLLGEDAEFTQGDQLTNSYERGREVSFSLEWRF